MKPVDRPYLGLQALRAGAALLVVAGHSTDYLLTRNGSIPASLSWIHGPAGVDLFFVLSGFVMMISSGRLLERARPVRLFLRRRIIRIVPLYWLLTTVRLAILAFQPSLAAHGMPSRWNIVASYLFIPATAATGEIRPVIPVGWTLSFEMLFYLVFAAGLVYPKYFLRIVTPAIVGLAIVGAFRPDTWPVFTAYADPIVLEFLGGVWVAVLLLRGQRLSKGAAIAAVISGLGGLALLVPGGHPVDRPVRWGVCALLVLAGSVALEDVIGWRLPGWLLLLGDASYSIYLVQVFFFPVLHLLVERLGPKLVGVHPAATGLAMMFVSVPAVGFIGVWLHRLVEKPMTKALRRWTDSSQPRAVTP